MINDLREDILRGILRSLPKLRGLHVVGCSKVDQSVVLRQVIHTPLLESLSMTTVVSGSSRTAFYNFLKQIKARRLTRTWIHILTYAATPPPETSCLGHEIYSPTPSNPIFFRRHFKTYKTVFTAFDLFDIETSRKKKSPQWRIDHSVDWKPCFYVTKTRFHRLRRQSWFYRKNMQVLYPPWGISAIRPDKALGLFFLFFLLFFYCMIKADSHVPPLF